MLLIDTVSLMTSEDYKDRLKAEYYQTKIRYVKLKEMLENWSYLEFSPTCEKSLLRDQCEAMKKYLDILKIRCEKEGVEV